MRALPPEVRRRRFGVEEYHRMLEAGVLSEDDRVELIGGEILDMTPIGGAHFTCVVNLTHSLVKRADGRYFVSVQNPVRLGLHDEPEPDLVLLREHPRGRLPVPEDVLLLIEVSDTSLTYDRDVKLPLYARAGIPEAWIVDIQGRGIEVHTEPASGSYRVSRHAGPGERLCSESVEGLSLDIDQVLG